MKIVKRGFVAALSLVGFQAHAVYGGDPIGFGEAALATTVNIKMSNGMCTGTILSANVVLTAAHCRDLFGEPQLVAHIHAGSTKKCEVSQVIDFNYAPDAKPDLAFRVHSPDILMLRLATPLCQVESAVLEREPLETGSFVIAAGHGAGNKHFGEVERIGLKILDTASVRSQVSPIDKNVENILTIGARTYLFALSEKPGSTLCTGDSGGPVYREVNGRVHLVGVNGATLSHDKLGVAYCDQAYVQVLTPIHPYITWIESKLFEWTDIKPM